MDGSLPPGLKRRLRFFFFIGWLRNGELAEDNRKGIGGKTEAGEGDRGTDRRAAGMGQ